MRQLVSTAGLAALVVGLATTAEPASLFSDDVAVAVDGDFYVQFQHQLEPDGDGTQRPGTINRAAAELAARPSLILNEFVRIDSGLTVGGQTSPWGQSSNRYAYDGEAASLGFSIDILGLHWETPAGVIDAGRVPWHWGLGVFENDARFELDRYGLPSGSGTQDMFRLRVAPLGVNVPLETTVFLRSWFNGRASDSDFVDNGWSYGVAAEGTPDLVDYGWLIRYDRHRGGGTNLLWTDAYNSWKFNAGVLEYEGAFRFGRTDDLPLVAPNGLRVSEDDAEWLGWGVVGRYLLRGVRKGKVSFETSGIEVGAFSGDEIAGAVEDGDWDGLYADPDFRVGLLLYPQVWNYRRQAFRQQLINAWGDRLGASAEQLGLTYDNRVGQGIGNSIYVNPGIGLRTDSDLRFRLNFLYARAIAAVSTLEVIDDGGTTQRSDDRYADGKSLGFEIDTHLSYPLWGGIYGVLEAGIAFPGSAFDNALGGDAKTSFILAPRLTAEF